MDENPALDYEQLNPDVKEILSNWMGGSPSWETLAPVYAAIVDLTINQKMMEGESFEYEDLPQKEMMAEALSYVGFHKEDTLPKLIGILLGRKEWAKLARVAVIQAWVVGGKDG